MHYTLQQNSWCKNQQIDFNNDTATTPSKTTKIRVYKWNSPRNKYNGSTKESGEAHERLSCQVFKRLVNRRGAIKVPLQLIRYQLCMDAVY
jgi:hypothetical protein